MGLFRKKEINSGNDEGDAQDLSLVTEPSAEAGGERDSRKCYLHLEELLKEQGSGVVMKLYIENFKRLNELFGYGYCEDLLEHILSFLKAEAGCEIYRYVGVEFIVVLKGYTIGQASRLAEKIGERFEHGWTVGDTDCVCSVQIGLCAYPGYPANADEMLKCLDMAVFKVAEMGSNQYMIYDSKLHNENLRRQAITRYLRTALDHHEIEVRYRPTYNTVTGRFSRAEFYMRIFVRDIGMVGAGEFIPIAEDSGQIRSVEYYALDQVGAVIAKLIAAGKEFESIALPISPVLLLQEDFLAEVVRVIERHQIPAGKLAIEIDEYAMSTAYVKITELMQALSELGVELILNHFGSGYSGLSQIFELPVDTLKFDRFFTWQLETTPQAEPIIEGLVQIARKVGLNLIAEGVETQKQLDALNRFGCELQQGFYYSPTLPEEVMIQILDTSREESQAILEQEKEKMKQ